MTRREQQCLRFIERFTVENDGVAPSLDEIAAELGLAARSGAARLVDSLVEQGRVRKRTNIPRSVEIIGLPAALILTSDEALMAECRRRGLVGVTI